MTAHFNPDLPKAELNARQTALAGACILATLVDPRHRRVMNDALTAVFDQRQPAGKEELEILLRHFMVVAEEHGDEPPFSISERVP